MEIDGDPKTANRRPPWLLAAALAALVFCAPSALKSCSSAFEAAEEPGGNEPVGRAYGRGRPMSTACVESAGDRAIHEPVAEAAHVEDIEAIYDRLRASTIGADDPGRFRIVMEFFGGVGDLRVDLRGDGRFEVTRRANGRPEIWTGTASDLEFQRILGVVASMEYFRIDGIQCDSESVVLRTTVAYGSRRATYSRSAGLERVEAAVIGFMERLVCRAVSLAEKIGDDHPWE